MELPELSLAPTSCRECSSSELSSDTNSSRKRKAMADSFLESKSIHHVHQNIDLQHSIERLPLDWEQCLDLESGKMYFLNRKTLKRSWDRPEPKSHHHDQYRQKSRLDLELNISSPAASNDDHQSFPKYSEIKKDQMMVAMACINCHLLVIVSESSPTCPNCKYVHSIFPPAQQIPRKPPTLNTLSLFS